MIVAVTIFFWQQNRPSASRTPAQAEIAAPSTGIMEPADSSPGAVWTVQVPPATGLSPDSSGDVRTRVHLKLRQWLETKTGDTETQDRLLKELQAMLTDDNVAGIIQSLSSEELATPFGTAALERWLKVDAALAANWIAARPDATENQAWVVARKLLEDPAGLEGYCDQLPDGEWKQNVLNGAGLDVLSRDPVEAIHLAQRMSPDGARTNLLQTVAYDWMNRDPDTALDWIQGVDDPVLQEWLTVAGVKAYAATDPGLAAGWLVSTVKSDAILNETVPNLVEIWSAKDPAAAAGWVARFPKSGARDASVDIITCQWLQLDPEAAIAWILNLPDRESVLTRLKSDQTEGAPDPQ